MPKSVDQYKWMFSKPLIKMSVMKLIVNSNITNYNEKHNWKPWFENSYRQSNQENTLSYSDMHILRVIHNDVKAESKSQFTSVSSLLLHPHKTEDYNTCSFEASERILFFVP